MKTLEEIVNLVSSSPLSRDRPVIGKRRDAGTIPTPLFNAFRARWQNPQKENHPLGDDGSVGNGNGFDDPQFIAIDSPTPLPRTCKAIPPECSPTPLDPKVSKTDEMNKEMRGDGVKTHLLRARTEASQGMVLVVDEQLQQKYELNLNSLRESMDISIERLPLRDMVAWRQLAGTEAEGGGSCNYGSVLRILDAQDIYAEARGGAQDDMEGLVRRWVAETAVKHEKFYLLVLGGRALASKIGTEINREFRQCVRNGTRLRPTPRKALSSWADLESLVWLAGLELGVYVQFLEQREDLSSHLLEISKCLARESSAPNYGSFSFYPGLGSRRTGCTLSETWRGFLETISRVTPTISEAIVAQYPSMNTLLQAYSILPAAEGEALLSNVRIGNRILGLSMSRRIYRIFATAEPSHLAYLANNEC